MSGTPGTPPRRFTPDQKVALVTEIARQHRAGLGTLREIATRLGTTDTSYTNWIREGIAPLPPGRRRPPYTPEERAERVGKVDRCIFRTNPIRDSAPKRSRIPEQSDRRFRAKPITDSALKPIAFSVRSGIRDRLTDSVIAFRNPGSDHRKGDRLAGAGAPFITRISSWVDTPRRRPRGQQEDSHAQDT